MLIRSLAGTNDDSRLHQRKSIVVYACVFNMSKGGDTSRIGLQYCIESSANDGRSLPSRLILVSAENFEVTDDDIPYGWRSAELDHVGEAHKAIKASESEGNNRLAEAIKQNIKDWDGMPPKTIIVSFPEMLEYGYYIAVHDDNMLESHYETFKKYKQQYESTYSNLLAD